MASGNNVEIVTETERCSHIIDELSKYDFIAMDAEGVNLGKEGPLTLLQIGTVDNKVYLFDIRLKPELFKEGHVEDLLQSEKTVKVIHSCSGNSAALYHQFGIKLKKMYLTHREKLKIIGREDDLEKLNKTALRISRKVARKHNKLFAFGLCNSTVFVPGDEKANAKVRDMFKEQIEWAVEEGVDYIIGETFNALGEAMLALECIKEYGKGKPAVITIAAYFPDITTDDVPIPEACRILEENGAAVVGLNCARGPETMLPLLREIRKTCKGPIAALPVPFRCTDEYRTFQSLKDPKTGKHLYLNDLESVRCNSADIRHFAHEAKQIGVQYISLCCGNFASYFRELAEVYGRTPPASHYSPDMSMNSVFGDEETGVTNSLAAKMKEFTLGIKK